MRCLSKSWENHNLCIERLHQAEMLRLNNKCNFMMENEFANIAELNCIFYGGHCDTQGRPVVYILLRNFLLKNVSED